LAWPGWNNNTWCFPYKAHEGRTLNISGETYEPFCLSCDGINDFWIKWDPENFRGICAWFPDPFGQTSFYYNEHFSWSIYVVLIGAFIVWIFDIGLPGFLQRGAARRVTDHVMPKRGRGRPRGS
jgi:hypothetical protein